jgi:hypothetical protein
MGMEIGIHGNGDRNWVGAKDPGSLAEHFRDDEDEESAEKTAPEEEINEGITGGSHDGNEE